MPQRSRGRERPHHYAGERQRAEDRKRSSERHRPGDGRIRRFIEKDPNYHGSSPVSAGLYLLSAALLDEIAAGHAVSLEHDVFARAPSGSLDAYAGRFAFIDIGTPESLKLAEHVINAKVGTRPA